MEFGIYICSNGSGSGHRLVVGNRARGADLARAEAKLEAQVEAAARGSEHFEALASNVLRQGTEQLLTLMSNVEPPMLKVKKPLRRENRP